MALRGLWKLSKNVEVEAKVVVVNHSGGSRNGGYTGLVEVQDIEDGAILRTVNVFAPYVEGVPGDRLCYWALQYRNPKLSPDQDGIGDVPKELIQALQVQDAQAEASSKAEADAVMARRVEAARAREAQLAAQTDEPKE